MEKTEQKVVISETKRHSQRRHEHKRSSKKKHRKSKRKTPEKRSSRTMDTKSKTTIPAKRKDVSKDRRDEQSSQESLKDNRSSRKKQCNTSKRDSPIVGKKTAQKRSSRSMETQSKTTIPMKRQDRRDEKSSQKSSSISKNESARSRSGSSKEDEYEAQKKKRRYEAPPPSLEEDKSITIKKTNDDSRKKSKDMLRKNSIVNEIKGVSQSVSTESGSGVSKEVDLDVYTGTTTSKKLFKPTFAESGSKDSNVSTLDIQTIPTHSCTAVQPAPAQKKPNCVMTGPHLSFRIHKNHKAKIVNIFGKKTYVDATNKSLKPEIKPAKTESGLSHFKQKKTDKQSHNFLEATAHRTREVPTLTVKPQATIIEPPALLYNQVQAVEDLYPAPLLHSSTITPTTFNSALGYNQVQVVEELYPAPLLHSSTITPTAVNPAMGYNQVQVVEELYPAPLPHSSTITPTAVNLAMGYNQVQVVEELYLARSEKRLEVNITESYGELTSMDIDYAEEAPENTQSTLSAQQNMIIVLDTNILLSHLDYVKEVTKRGFGCLGFPVVLIPWVVLQELDSLKQGRGISGSVAHLAIPAISFIYTCITKKDPHLCGQSMQQASESSYGLKTENNDDRVLQCCLQYQTMYPECVLILCTNDKNLCCKAILSGVKASTKKDLETDVVNCRQDIQVQNLSPAVPGHHGSTPVPVPVPVPVPGHNQDKTALCVGHADKESEENLLRCASELEECLQKVLSDVLEVEMKAVFNELWLEIIVIKPPWTLLDILYCFKKHWIAVFGQVVSRHLLQTVITLMDFFKAHKNRNHNDIFDILLRVKEFLNEFLQRSSRVPHAISVIDNIYTQLQPQSNDVSSIEETSTENVEMKDAEDEDKQHLPTQVCHQYVWSTFESIWTNLFNTCMKVFTAVGYDPYTKQSAQPVGSQTPQQEAFVCLHELSSTVSQLLQAFSSVMSMAPDMKQIEALLSIIYSMKIADENSRVTAKDLLECFSQPDYREKVQCGVQQLMEIHQVLNHCIQVNTL